MAKEAYDLIYQEAVRGLTQQQQSLDGLRSRAGSLISATAIATSFLGGIAVDSEGGLGGAGWFAIAFFFVIMVLNVAILAPWWTWTFEVSPKALIQSVERDEPFDVAELSRDLAFHFDDYFVKNQAQLNKLFVAFQVAGILLLAEIIAWVIEIAR